MHLAADRAAVRPVADLDRQQPGLRPDLGEVLADGHIVPDRASLVVQAGHQHRGREDQQFRARGRIGDGQHVFGEVEAGELGQQPAAQRPRRIILAADGEPRLGQSEPPSHSAGRSRRRRRPPFSRRPWLACCMPGRPASRGFGRRCVDDLSGVSGAIGLLRPDAPDGVGRRDQPAPALAEPHPADPVDDGGQARRLHRPAHRREAPTVRSQTYRHRQPARRGRGGGGGRHRLRQHPALQEGYRTRAAARARRGSDVGPFRHAAARDRADFAHRPRRLHHRLAQHPRRAESGGAVFALDLRRGGDALPARARRGHARDRRVPAGRAGARRRRPDGGGRRPRRSRAA